MATNSPNRNVAIIIAGAAFICLCLCVLFIGGVFAFREEVVKAVPALEPVLSARQDTATPVPALKPTRTQAPTRTPRPTDPPAPTEPPVPTELPVPTEPPAPTEALQLTKPPATKTSRPAQATPTTAQATKKPTSTRPAASDPPADVARSMDEIQQQVIELRGLQPSGTFTRGMLSRDQLREITISDFEENYPPEDKRNDVLVLSALGLLEPGFDLGSFYIELLSEQIAGQYDPETKEMYVVSDKFGGTERLTYSHEYDHALVDQNYDIKNGLHYDTDPCKQDSERCAGIQALIEGDASLAEMSWFTQYATAQDYADIRDFYDNYTSPVYDSAPEFMKEDLLFPYTTGQAFVQHLFDQGGWEAVDAAYDDVPVSTEQIMHPERYPDDKPVKVELADFTSALGDGWQEIDRGVMGEWYTYLILAKGIDSSFRLNEDTAPTAAEGWGGDSYTAYYNEQSDETVLVLSYEWDTLSDADEFASALIQYGTQRFGQPASSDVSQTTWIYTGGYSIFQQAGQATLWVIAPSQAAAEAVWAEIVP
jgi:hypothetical protein